VKVSVLLICLLGFMSIVSYAQQSWEIDRDKGGIIVYTKEEEGSAFKSFKAVITIQASTDEIVEVLKNADDYTKWYGYTNTSALLKEEGDTQYNYVETIFPWPYSNRDMVYRMSVNVSANGAVKILLKGIPDYLPEKRGIVRMKKAEGYILLQPLDGKTEVTYVFHSEPGDNIPPWLANNSIGELPFRTLYGLRKRLGE
jgi:hypothetical protein